MLSPYQCPAVNHSHVSSFYTLHTAVSQQDMLCDDILTPEAIQRKIEIQSHNIGWVAGKMLRQMWDACIDMAWNIIVSIQDIRESHIANIEDFDYRLHPHINAKECIEEHQEQCAKDYPQAMVVHANYFRSNFIPGFAIMEQFLDERALENTMRNQMFLNSLAKHYRVHNIKIFTPPSLCNEINRIQRLGPLRLIIINAHGNPYSITIDNTANFRKDSIDIFDFYYNNLGEQDLSCLETLPDNSVIILNSCNTAKDAPMKLSNSTYILPMNVQKLFAMHAPNSVVYAPDFTILKNSLIIKFSSGKVGSVYAMGIRTDSPVDLLKCIVSYPAFFIDSPFLNEMLMEKLDSISPHHAPFCKETLPYFSMKRYCDNAQIKPSQKKIDKCNADPQCQEAASILHYINTLTKNKCNV